MRPDVARGVVSDAGIASAVAEVSVLRSVKETFPFASVTPVTWSPNPVAESVDGPAIFPPTVHAAFDPLYGALT